MSWGIADTAPEIEKIKAESADYLNGLKWVRGHMDRKERTVYVDELLDYVDGRDTD